MAGMACVAIASTAMGSLSVIHFIQSSHFTSGAMLLSLLPGALTHWRQINIHPVWWTFCNCQANSIQAKALPWDTLFRREIVEIYLLLWFIPSATAPLAPMPSHRFATASRSPPAPSAINNGQPAVPPVERSISSNSTNIRKSDLQRRKPITGCRSFRYVPHPRAGRPRWAPEPVFSPFFGRTTKSAMPQYGTKHFSTSRPASPPHRQIQPEGCGFAAPR